MLSATQGNIYEYSSENFTKILDTIISDSSEMMYKLCSTSEVEVDESQSSQELFLEEQALNGSERIKTLVTYLELNLLRMEK
jgi:hypothetical protein